MHEVVDFSKSIFKGLWEAIKTDVDVFLLAFSGLLWPFKFTKGLSVSTLIYVIIRRVDGVATAFISTKHRKATDAEATE